MNLERFLRERQPSWDELHALLERARTRPERLGAPGALRLGALYRAAAADLSLARRRFPRDPSLVRLEDLVGRARNLVYDVEPRRETVRDFLGRGYWRRIAERPELLAVAAVLLFAPAVAAIVWAHADPAQAGRLVGGEFSVITERRGGDLGLSVDEQTTFAFAIFVNNIRVTFLAFAGGILAGLGTAAVLLFNGLFLGTVAGLAIEAGNGSAFTELVVAHGVLELSCIVVGGAAGLRMGWALVDPGHRSRGEALTTEGRRAVEIIVGTIPFLVLAGLVEGFITPSGFGLGANVAVGMILGAAYWVIVFARGARDPSPVSITGVPGSSPEDTPPRTLR